MRWNLSPRLVSANGDALIITIVVLSVVALAGLAGLQMAMVSKKGVESQMRDSDMDVMVHQLNSLLRNGDSCRIALGGPATLGAPANAPANYPARPPAYVYPTPNSPIPNFACSPLPCIAQQIVLPSNANLATFPKYDIIIYSADQKSVALGPGTVWNKRLTIESIQLQLLTDMGTDYNGDLGTDTGGSVMGGSVGQPIFYGMLTINAYKSSLTGTAAAENPNATFGGGGLSNSKIRLMIKTDGYGGVLGVNLGRIIGCSSMTFQGPGDYLAATVPHSPGNPHPWPLPVCRPGQVLYSNGNQVYCIRVSCPYTYSPSYVGPDGNIVKCCNGGGSCL